MPSKKKKKVVAEPSPVTPPIDFCSPSIHEEDPRIIEVVQTLVETSQGDVIVDDVQAIVDGTVATDTVVEDTIVEQPTSQSTNQKEAFESEMSYLKEKLAASEYLELENSRLQSQVSDLNGSIGALEQQVVDLQANTSTLFNDTKNLLAFFTSYKTVTELLQDVDRSADSKMEIIRTLVRNKAVDHFPQAVYEAILFDEWDVAAVLLQHVPKGDQWKVLRKLLGNWESIRDRRRLKEFLVACMKEHPAAMATLNNHAKTYSKYGKVIRGYTDLCMGCADAQKFAMIYSEL
jgi:hypothetical protein